MARLDRVNAQLRARRPALLADAGVRELLARPTLEARLELLGRLRPGLFAGGAPPRDLDALDAALRAGLRAEAARIVAMVEGAGPRRALAAAVAADEVGLVKERLRAHPTADVAAALEREGHPLAPALRDALAAPGPRDLAALELALDRAALASARATCGPGEDGAVLRAYLEDRVDARNALTLLVLAGGGAAPSPDGFVPGGRRFAEPAFHALALAPLEAVRTAVAAAFPEVAGAVARPWAAERALERVLLAGLRRTARRAPLSLAVPLLYLAERRAEIRRLGVVLRGAELGLPGDDLLDLAEA